MPSSTIRRTPRGNPLATKSQLVARVNDLDKLYSALVKSTQPESLVSVGLHKSEYNSFKSAAGTAISALKSGISRLRGRIQSGNHN